MSNQVQITTQLDIICPSIVITKKGLVRCEGGVGHEGRCRHGRRRWDKTPAEQMKTNAVILQINQEKRYGPHVRSQRPRPPEAPS